MKRYKETKYLLLLEKKLGPKRQILKEDILFTGYTSLMFEVIFLPYARTIRDRDTNDDSERDRERETRSQRAPALGAEERSALLILSPSSPGPPPSSLYCWRLMVHNGCSVDVSAAALLSLKKCDYPKAAGRIRQGASSPRKGKNLVLWQLICFRILKPMCLFLCCSSQGSKRLLKDKAGLSLAKQSQEGNFDLLLSARGEAAA